MLIKIDIDDCFEHKLNCIQQVTHLNTSEIIEQAIDLLYEKVKSIDKHEPGCKMQAFLKSDFIGCVEGYDDLSTNYKEYFYQGIKKKHGLAWYGVLV